MRLINVHDFVLEEFYDNEVPEYTILSHTWKRNQEITFEAFDGPHDAIRHLEGFKKVQEICRLTAQHGLSFTWIDTCCIDKRSSAELSEAINSMYKWYTNAEHCYVHLADVHNLGGVPHDAEGPLDDPQRIVRLRSSEFATARWFTRGWTLQELVAPKTVIFYDAQWSPLGVKRADERLQKYGELQGLPSLSRAISKITGIDECVLQAPELVFGGRFCIANKMSWAANRETSRSEDAAYCLLGLFNINIPLLYGEGPRAFVRLQHEIIRNSDDHSIFVFQGNEGFLADAPKGFRNGHNVSRLRSKEFNRREHFTLTNRGLLARLPILYDNHPSGSVIGVLACRYKDNYVGPIGICLQPSKMNKRLHYVTTRRIASSPSASVHEGDRIVVVENPDTAKVEEIYLSGRPRLHGSLPGSTTCLLHFRDTPTAHLELVYPNPWRQYQTRQQQQPAPPSISEKTSNDSTVTPRYFHKLSYRFEYGPYPPAEELSAWWRTGASFRLSSPSHPSTSSPPLPTAPQRFTIMLGAQRTYCRGQEFNAAIEVVPCGIDETNIKILCSEIPSWDAPRLGAWGRVGGWEVRAEIGRDEGAADDRWVVQVEARPTR